MKYAFSCVSFYVLSLVFFGALAQEKITINISTDKNALSAIDSKDLPKAGTTEKTQPVRTVSSAPVSANTISTVPVRTSSRNAHAKESVSDKSPKIVCPGKEVRRPFFSIPCAATKDCAFMGRGLLCCDRRCIKGVQPPKPETKHTPTFFGFVERVCPIHPIPELWEIKECVSDDDCSPRICCPETLRTGENVSYCRTAYSMWEKLPAARQFVDPIRNLVSYMQCTPPPPPLLDLFPKPCENPLDCFPNLCCQEGGKRFCRPPKRSFFALVAAIGQRLIPAGTARRIIERITT